MLPFCLPTPTCPAVLGTGQRGEAFGSHPGGVLPREKDLSAQVQRGHDPLASIPKMRIPPCALPHLGHPAWPTFTSAPGIACLRHWVEAITPAPTPPSGGPSCPGSLPQPHPHMCPKCPSVPSPWVLQLTSSCPGVSAATLGAGGRMGGYLRVVLCLRSKGLLGAEKTAPAAGPVESGVRKEGAWEARLPHSWPVPVLPDDQWGPGRVGRELRPASRSYRRPPLLFTPCPACPSQCTKCPPPGRPRAPQPPGLWRQPLPHFAEEETSFQKRGVKEYWTLVKDVCAGRSGCRAGLKCADTQDCWPGGGRGDGVISVSRQRVYGCSLKATSSFHMFEIFHDKMSGRD